VDWGQEGDKGHRETHQLGCPQGKDLPEPSMCTPLTPLDLDHGADEGHQETHQLGYPQGKDLPEPSTYTMSLTPLDLDHGADNMPTHTHHGRHTTQQWGHNVGSGVTMGA
jgi:hypothetical protein